MKKGGCEIRILIKKSPMTRHTVYIFRGTVLSLRIVPVCVLSLQWNEVILFRMIALQCFLFMRFINMSASWLNVDIINLFVRAKYRWFYIYIIHCYLPYDIYFVLLCESQCNMNIYQKVLLLKYFLDIENWNLYKFVKAEISDTFKKIIYWLSRNSILT